MLKNINIGSKLAIGFGLMALITLLVVVLNQVSSTRATRSIDHADEVQLPVVLASARAQADVLHMSDSLRGYLILGDPAERENYEASARAFEADLQQLETLSSSFDPANQQRLADLKAAYEEWQALPPQLFDLRNNQMAREPAYAWLNTTGGTHLTTIQTKMDTIIQIQVEREPTAQNVALLRDLAEFQRVFVTIFSSLRGYVTTGNSQFRTYEYETNATIAHNTWEKIMRQQTNLNAEQQRLLDDVATARQAFFDDVPTKVFAVMESEEWRQDLFLFQTRATPLSAQMTTLLQEMSSSHQAALRDELRSGRKGLAQAHTLSRWGGIVAIIVTVVLIVVSWRLLVLPMRRLIGVAERIQQGELEATAPVKSRDEIGTFAATFNTMTAQLRQQIETINQEKQRTAALQAEVIESQKALLYELSTPIFPVADGVVVMPMIGSIDSTRAQQMTDALLRSVASQRARVAILDITGVPVVDIQVASAIVRTDSAVRLLGTRMLLTGIRAEVAHTLVSIGADLGAIETHNNLQSGILHALSGRSSDNHDRGWH